MASEAIKAYFKMGSHVCEAQGPGGKGGSGYVVLMGEGMGGREKGKGLGVPYHYGGRGGEGSRIILKVKYLSDS